MSSSALFPPSLMLAQRNMHLTCDFSSLEPSLGGESPPATLIAFPLVTGLRAVSGVFATLVELWITPAQSLYLQKVELGGIEPPA